MENGNLIGFFQLKFLKIFNFNENYVHWNKQTDRKKSIMKFSFFREKKINKKQQCEKKTMKGNEIRFFFLKKFFKTKTGKFVDTNNKSEKTRKTIRIHTRISASTKKIWLKQNKNCLLLLFYSLVEIHLMWWIPEWWKSEKKKEKRKTTLSTEQQHFYYFHVFFL